MEEQETRVIETLYTNEHGQPSVHVLPPKRKPSLEPIISDDSDKKPENLAVGSLITIN